MQQFFMDSHMHFDLYKNRSAVLDYIEDHKSYTIAMTNLPDLYRRYYDRQQEYRYTRIALGFHPELVKGYINQLDTFADYVGTTKYIGEVGLDFCTPDKMNRQAQVETFSEIVRLCSRGMNKIMSIHSRKAESECLRILAGYSGKAILHWYSGSKRCLQEALERGYYFSVNHQMLLSAKGKAVIDLVPLNRLLLESDAPFTKGLENNYSISFCEKVYTYLSNSRNVGLDDLCSTIKKNFTELLS